MLYPLTVPGFEGRQLMIELPGLFSGANLMVDGRHAPKGPGRGEYLLRRPDGTSAIAKLKAANFLDPLPKVMVDGVMYQAAAALKWYQYVWIALPLFLVFIGGAIGGGLGGLATALNGRVFRTGSSTMVRYLLSSLITEVVVVGYFVTASLISSTFFGPAPQVAAASNLTPAMPTAAAAPNLTPTMPTETAAPNKTSTSPTAAAASNKTPAPPTAAASPQEFKNTAGGFAVTSPYTFKESTQSVDTLAGKIEVHIFAADQNSQSLMVMYSDYPASMIKGVDIEKVYDGGRDGAVNNVKGQLVSEKKIWLYGAPGREILVKAKTSSGLEVMVRDRIYLVGNRLYQVMAVALAGKETTSEIEAFLNSFRLLSK